MFRNSLHIRKGKTFKHSVTGEMIHIAAIAKNHFHGCRVAIYESSFSPAEYHYLPEKSEAWEYFEPCPKKEFLNWYENHKEYLNKTAVYHTTND